MIEADIYKFLNNRKPGDSKFMALNKLVEDYVNTTVAGASPKALNVMLDEIKAQVAAIAATNIITGGSAVKSVQRGVANGSYGSGTNGNTTVAISTVNPLKCAVTIQGGSSQSATTISSSSNTALPSVALPFVSSLTADYLSVQRGGWTQGSDSYAYYASVSWQIIEYY